MIRLYYFKNNYGDDLSPYLISRLSNDSIRFSKPFSIKRLIIDILIMGRDLAFFKGFHNFSFSYTLSSPLLLSVGSIISLAKKNCSVWGSGIHYKEDPINIYAKIKAVRGPLTLERLIALGYQKIENIAIGDPALLLPLIYTPSSKKKYKIGIILHNNDLAYISSILKNSKLKNAILLISLKTKHKSVEEITDEICSCEMILSTSLHGLIVPHAYGIPALRIKKHKIHGDGVKFTDYFQSVGIPHYEPLRFADLELDSLNSLQKLFSQKSQFTLPSANILEIQRNLFRAAPFKLKDKFYF